MPTPEVPPARPLSPDTGWRQPDDRPRREDCATTFDAVLAQAVAEKETR
jgi:hypothetical protein